MAREAKPLEDQTVTDPDSEAGFTDQYSKVFNCKPRWVDSLLQFFFPARCLLCRDILPSAAENYLCSSCIRHYRPGGIICPQCEGFSRGVASCSCLPEASPLEALFTISLYDQKWRHLIHDLKYRKRRASARPLGAWLASEIINQDYCAPDLVVPIPLHRTRERERGYNQSVLLARSTAQALNIPCRELLIKYKHTRSQTAITRRERHENLRGVFKCASPLPPGVTILLIDDVYSTGTTMKEASIVLHSRGARIFGAVIAYNPNIKVLQSSGFYAGLDNW